MRGFIKRQMLEILNTMQESIEKINVFVEIEHRVEFLQLCQTAAIALGKSIEENILDNKAVISNLERYCEELYLLSQRDVVSKADIASLNKILKSVTAVLVQIPSTYVVFFLPYKASMWDSLESVWTACVKDERCECYVMPIPYFSVNRQTEEMEFCYEGSLFPPEVPIVNYQDYSLESIKPDIAYIHNPFDSRNFVTSIHPAFYSDKLKHYVKKLVYIPYYVTTGHFSKRYLHLPVCNNMDFMVVQSEQARNDCRGQAYYNKILPFGSPKFDKVINACKNDTSIPAQWKNQLNVKKILMLNTSISCFLQDGDVYLKKIKKVCQLIKNQSDVAVIWRPHPLLEATIKSLRPNLLSEYHELLAFFLDNHIGVLDNTPDITRTVAISDAYIGEENSSVINLFGVAGKPIFILDNYLLIDVPEEKKRVIRIRGMEKYNNQMWITTYPNDGIFCMNLDTREVSYMARVEDSPKWSIAHPFLTREEDKLYLIPYFSNSFVSYDVNTGETEYLQTSDENLMSQGGVSFEGKVFYLPGSGDAICEYDTTDGSWHYHTSCIVELRGAYDGSELKTFDCAVYGENVWISAEYTNHVLQFNMKNYTYSIHNIGKKDWGYTGIAVDEKYLWLSEVHNGAVVRWNKTQKDIAIYKMPEEFRFWQNTVGRNLVNLKLIDMGKYIVSIPGYSNGMVKIDKVTGRSNMLIREFWEFSERTTDLYNPSYFLSSSVGAQIDETSILVQRYSDKALALIDIEDETYEVFYPTISESDYEKMTKGEDGFEKKGINFGFFRKESEIFSLEGFIEDLIKGNLNRVRERQLEELSTLAANLDGTCGDKIHEYMMRVLEEQW